MKGRGVLGHLSSVKQIVRVHPSFQHNFWFDCPSPTHATPFWSKTLFEMALTFFWSQKWYRYVFSPSFRHFLHLVTFFGFLPNNSIFRGFSKCFFTDFEIFLILKTTNVLPTGPETSGATPILFVTAWENDETHSPLKNRLCNVRLGSARDTLMTPLRETFLRLALAQISVKLRN